MIDTTALRSISYGLYIVTSKKEGRDCGCVINTFTQVTSDPLQVSIAINKENYTTAAILQTGKFEISVLGQDISMDTVRAFGFKTSGEVNKFEGLKTGESEIGLKYLIDNVVASFSVETAQTLDLGTHLSIIGEVVAAQVLSDESPMTYAYYHTVKNGKTPPKASSYIPPTLQDTALKTKEAKEAPKVAWRCTICGYVEHVDELPNDFKCPICGVGKDKFERIEV